MTRCYQLVVCDGPRCSARGRPGELLAAAERLRAESPELGERLYVSSFSCLSRCPAGPNVLVRSLPEGARDPGAPGLFDLDGGHHYWAVNEALLRRLLRAHCAGDGPLPGRSQRY